MKIRQKETDRVEVIAYDQTWYLKKNKETYVFNGKTGRSNPDPDRGRLRPEMGRLKIPAMRSLP